jgi:O-antigen/teichoic acid export membrane protein
VSVSISGKALAEGITLTIVSEAKENGDKEQLRKIYLLLTEYMYILTFPAIAGVYALGGDLLSLFYGGKVDGALAPMLVYLPFMAFHKLGGLTANFLAALDKERLMVAGRFVAGGGIIALDILLIPTYGALGAVYAACFAISLVVIFEIVLMHIFLRPRYPWGYMGKMMVIGVVVWGGAAGVNTLLADLPAVLRLGLAVGVGVIAYALGLWLLKPISAENLNLAATLKLPAKKWMLRLLMPKSERS